MSTMMTAVIGLAILAPVPASPKELTPALMAGQWDYAWAHLPNGTIWLHADGTYNAVHFPDSPVTYFGTYTVVKDTVTLTEWSFFAKDGRTGGPWEYVFVLDVTKYPYLKGTSNGRDPVILSNPKRH